MPRVAQFLDLYQHDFQRQARVGIDAREVDQLLEYIEHGPLFRAATARDDAAARALLFDEVFAGDDRLDEPHLMLAD